MNEFSRPFAVSAVAHIGLIALLFLIPMAAPKAPKIDLSNAVSVVFAPATTPPAPAPPAPAQPAPEPPPPPPVAEQPPPPPPPPQPIEQPPPPPAPVAETPPPKPEVKPEPKPIPKPRPRPQPVQQAEQPLPQLPLPLPMPSQAAPAPTAAPRMAGPQTASIPSPPPAPTISADYRTLLSSWLESHKRYPEEARQRGEQGRAILRFRVDRSGRVLDYAVVSSSGFADLDQAVENMMRGAVLPPFPPSMTSPEIEVSVTIRFGLTQ